MHIRSRFNNAFIGYNLVQSVFGTLPLIVIKVTQIPYFDIFFSQTLQEVVQYTYFTHII